MKHGVKFTYDEIKNYVEVESKSGCKLLSTEYLGANEHIQLQCKCGNEFETTFSKFKNRNKRQCNNCFLFQQRLRFQLSYNEVKSYIESLGYTLISKEYKNTDTPIIICDKYGYYYTPLLYNLKIGQHPSAFQNSNIYTIQNIKLWCKLNNKPFQLISIEYKDSHINLQWKCLKNNCGEIFESTWAHVMSGNCCPYCAGKQVGLSNCLAIKRPDLLKQWHPTKNDNLTAYDVTKGSQKNIWWACTCCGHEWQATITSRRKINGCPRCGQSFGEICIDKILNKYNIIYQYNYRFKNCIYKRPLSFDFYLPQYNILIEYQGLQHYEPVDFAGQGIKWANTQFKLNQKRDSIKRKYCLKNNIKLLEIPYWDFNNIEEIIKKELNL